VRLASKRFLAGSLGVAAGVMLYVSLVEIFVKSQMAFTNHGYSEADAYLYATLSLFGGILFYKGIDYVVHLLEGGPVGDHNVDIHLYDLDGSSSAASNSPRTASDAAAASATDAKGNAPKPHRQNHHRRSSRDSQFPHEHDVVVELSTGGSTVRPSPDLHTLQLSMAGRVQAQQQQQQQQQQQAFSPVSALTPAAERGSSENNDSGSKDTFMEEGVSAPPPPPQEALEGAEAGNSGGGGGATGVDGDNAKLVRMGVMTAVAIGIHNFPEGLATFVATLSDPSVGLALAVAIAIHNIPEGLCVAIPVYYATGNRWKAFGWALLSGVSEPIGAGLGWLILKDIMSELVYGVLFGVVAGMMVNITIHELIPTAVRYDPADKVTTNSIIAGMAIMAASLTLFLY
ncbi:unnamed protein product, partial [Hapterophycus canaliculatus]